MSLGEFMTLQRGFDLPEQRRRAGNVPVVTSAGISARHDTAMVKGPGVVMGRYGRLGRVYFVREDFWPHNTALWVRDFHGNDPLFAAYFLGTLHYGGFSDKSAVPGLNRNDLHRIPVQIPPLAQQRAIAHILGTLDDKIESSRRMNETLEAMARAIFKSWFVDFDPVRAKAADRKPRGLDPATAALFPDSFQNSELSKIPKGWRVIDLPDVIAVNPSRQLRRGDVAPYVEMSSLPNHSARVLAWEDRPFGSGTRFTNGDVLLARITPCLENGKTAFVDFLEDGEVAWGSTEFIILHSKSPLPAEFAYFLARSDAFREHAIQNMTGTSGRQRVPASCLDHYLIATPPEPIAKRFGEVVRPLVAAMKANDEQSQTVAAIRDALLPKLISGEVRVKDADRIVGRMV